MEKIAAAFNPGSIAIVGASTDPRKVGAVIVENLKKSGFTGKIYPVNPKTDTLAGLPCYPSLAAIPDSVEQVTICVPAASVLDIVEQCVIKKVSSIVIIAAGFGETGPDNKKLEDKISEICKENNITLIGPNVIGLIHPSAHLNNSWVQKPAPAGNIAFISQSGALCCAVLDVAAQYQLGFSHCCSLGNKAGLDELDLIRYFMDDPETKVIACYLEDIRSGHDFVKFLRERVDKPVVIFHSGRTAPAATAALSHTGALTSERDLLTTAFQQASVLEATSLHEFCLLLQAFSTFEHEKFPEFGRFGIVTNAGGAGIIATDEIVEHGWSLATFGEATTTALRAALPNAAATSNPVDVLGDATADRYVQVADIIGQDSEVDIILFILTPQHVTQPEATAQAIADFATRHPEKVVLAAFLGADSVAPARQALLTRGVLAFGELHDAIWIANKLIQRGRNLYDHHDSQTRHDYRMSAAHGSGKYHALLDAVINSAPGKVQILNERLTSAMMREVDIELPAQTVVTTYKDALAFAQQHFPVVIKAPNQTLAHKTETGAIVTNITTPEALDQAFTALQHQLWTEDNDRHHPPAILIQEMITGTRLEFFVGAKRDGHRDVYAGGQPGFGHLLTFGKGGIYTQINPDLARVLVPLRRRAIKERLWRTQLNAIIQGYRGQPPLPETKIVGAIKSVQQLVIGYPEISAIDINPLLVTDESVFAVDVKIFIAV